jgi:hypothetical protein
VGERTCENRCKNVIILFWDVSYHDPFKLCYMELMKTLDNLWKIHEIEITSSDTYQNSTSQRIL